MPKQAIRALFGALGVESVGVGADAAWHDVWHHTMQGEGLLHPWPHAVMGGVSFDVGGCAQTPVELPSSSGGGSRFHATDAVISAAQRRHDAGAISEHSPHTGI